MKSITLKPDIFGAIASSLCMVHCLATPLLFITHVYGTFGSETVPLWWKNLDYLFLIVSFTAVYRSTQTTSKKFMKYALWAGWAILFSMILNEKMMWLNIPGIFKYTAAIGLSTLHIYNLKYCQCKDENCCAKRSCIS